MTELLRLITCGSVDDGKSTLIGRLLLESGQVADDHLAALEADSKRFGTQGDAIDVALLLDGLQAEREQGITIDVAYRHFGTSRRRFLVADTPGHVQYTRNMITGASTADLAVILVDARKGINAQTKRHSMIVGLVGIRHVLLAVNKMDLTDFSKEIFDSIESEFREFISGTSISTSIAVPVSGLLGDNVRDRSLRTPWYLGPTLIEFLEEFHVDRSEEMQPFRLPIQMAIRPSDGFRGLCGLVSSGRVEVGDEVAVVPSGQTTRISRIVSWGGDVTSAEAGQSVTVCLQDEVDASRGDILAGATDPLQSSSQLRAQVVWMSEQDLLPGRSYLLKIGTQTVGCSVLRVKSVVDVESLGQVPASRLTLNDIGILEISTKRPIAFEPYERCRALGGFLIIDRESFATLGAGMIEHDLRRSTNIRWQETTITKRERRTLNGHSSGVIWMTGLPGSGKSTLANQIEQRFHERAVRTFILDGDNLRHGLSRDLGFTSESRVENLRRAGEVARILVDAGIVVIASFVSPYEADRLMVREMFESSEFIEIHVDAPLEKLVERDPKGLYAKALRGEITNFTGVNSPYEKPVRPDLRVDTGSTDVDITVAQIMDFLDRIEFI